LSCVVMCSGIGVVIFILGALATAVAATPAITSPTTTTVNDCLVFIFVPLVLFRFCFILIVQSLHLDRFSGGA
jgi:hypothetical protein